MWHKRKREKKFLKKKKEKGKKVNHDLIAFIIITIIKE